MIRLTLLLVSSAILGCGNSHQVNGEKTQQDSNELKAVLENPEQIDFAQVQRLVFQKNCVACHNSAEKKDGLDLSTYESVANGNGDRKFIEAFNPQSSALFTALLAQGKRHMPPNDKPQLTPEQINLVYLWIENGAKSSTGIPADRPASLKEQLAPYFANPETIDYPVVRKYLLGAVCMKCHSLNGDAPDKHAIVNSANMTTYATLFNAFTPIIVKGRPEQSKLFQSTAITQSMPPSTDGYDPVDGLRNKLIRLWILNCAIEEKAALINEDLTHDPDNPEKVRTCQE